MKLTRGQCNATFVAKGEADIAVQLSNEIRMVPGIEFIPFAPEFGRTFAFSAALGKNAGDANAAKTIFRFLAGPETAAVVDAKWMIEPQPIKQAHLAYGSTGSFAPQIQGCPVYPE
ncbi:substrate-binding domain-containing protein [Rhodoplanes sp. Z2-YC6860]|uniref:substrate-binding domain-containing protein n=1 Tax=Rhodoplanes sp. Z2-YC6860 TaxID=674703 RepID=UPI00082CCC12|nr:substrate-binding domain-containing protein [Rhodoplanes sp. Z2-YC6860]